MSAMGLDLEGRVNLGRWRPLGGGSSHLRVYSAGPVLGFNDITVNRTYKGKEIRKTQGDNCSWNILESGRRTSGVSVNGW